MRTDRLAGWSPQWRVFYKAPLKKRTADLQWRILHGAIATNAFLSVINPTVVNVCPFCNLSENVFHMFTECKRLTEFFNVLTAVFKLFNIIFSLSVFIGGLKYSKREKCKWQILNFLLGEAKMAIYLTRRDKLQNEPVRDMGFLWKTNIKARLKLEFCFYKATNNIPAFIEQWGCDDALCTVSGENLIFGSSLA